MINRVINLLTVSSGYSEHYRSGVSRGAREVAERERGAGVTEMDRARSSIFAAYAPLKCSASKTACDNHPSFWHHPSSVNV